MAGRAAELAALIPALAAALSRDTAPGSGGRALSGGVPFNTDVMHAIVMVAREIPATAQAACEATGERWHHRPVGTCLIALPRLHGRLLAISQPAAAGRIEGAAERWMRTVKLALGLRKPDTAIGADCPLHDEPPCPLVMIGSEAFLRDGNTLMWAHDGRIWCRECGAAWLSWQWPLLERLLAESARIPEARAG